MFDFFGFPQFWCCTTWQQCDRNRDRDWDRDWDRDEDRDDRRCRREEFFQHTHEFQGNTFVAGSIPHVHRIAGVTGPAIRRGNSHVHEVATRTSTDVNHFHFIRQFTGPAIPIGNGRHIHMIRGNTSFNAGHRHFFDIYTFAERFGRSSFREGRFENARLTFNEENFNDEFDDNFDFDQNEIV